jgi:exodeoxyribonuclease VII small subunit
MSESQSAAKPEIPDDVAQMSFEQALEELRQIVGRLESGEGKLDEAIAAYERGAQLKAHCEAKLREAQAKIEKIALGPDGQPRTEPFDPN